MLYNTQIGNRRAIGSVKGSPMVELVWDGKYDKDGNRVAPLRVSLPFQTVETVNEDPIERRRQLDLFAAGRETAWRNRLIWGDKKYVLPSLLPEFAGKVDLIYIDPPFATGADFSFQANVGDQRFTKDPSIIERKAYRDTWGDGIESYVSWFYESVVILRELLSETGQLYVHLDWHIVHYAKAILDEVFGITNFQNEIVWRRANTHNDAKGYGRIHDTILYYRMPDAKFNLTYTNYREEYIDQTYRHKDSDGRRYTTLPLHAPRGTPSDKTRTFGELVLAAPEGKSWRWSQSKIDKALAEDRIVISRNNIPRYKKYLDEAKGVLLQSLWTDMKILSHPEILGYPTQKPEALLERIIRASSNEGDLVLDCFCGSGTTAAVAEKLNRRWIACDLGRFAIHTTRKRLLGIDNARPFVVQNLGKYERQVWQKAEFGEEAAHKMRSYRKFILDLYHAELVDGYAWLHGVKGGRMVHVGSVDSPVAVGDVRQMAIEFRRAIGSGKDAPTRAGVDVLGWDFALDMNETAQQIAAEAGVNIRFLRIPREVLEKKAVDQGDIRFFELAALDVDLRQQGRSVTIRLTDFMIPPDDVPADVQKAVRQWEDWIDYWAVDFNYRDDTFHNQWQSYRTRKERGLLISVQHTYETPGEYVVLVKAIDILGNDTTKTLRVTVM